MDCLSIQWILLISLSIILQVPCPMLRLLREIWPDIVILFDAFVKRIAIETPSFPTTFKSVIFFSLLWSTSCQPFLIGHCWFLMGWFALWNCVDKTGGQGSTPGSKCRRRELTYPMLLSFLRLSTFKFVCLQT